MIKCGIWQSGNGCKNLKKKHFQRSYFDRQDAQVTRL